MKELLEGDTPLTTGGPVREAGGRAAAGHPRPAAADHPLLPLPRRRAAGTVARSPLDDSGSSVVQPRQRSGRAPAVAATVVAAIRQAGRRCSSRSPTIRRVVDNYLTATLARRLNLRLPEEKQTKSAYADFGNELGLNLGTESLRMAMQQDRILGLNNLDQPADQPLPEPLQPPALEVPEPAADVQVEPIAMRVPAECFYVRFGSFANFLWLQDTLAKWGGDAQNLIALRGLDRGMSSRMEKQLVLKQTVLSRMLGDTVIADVAIIGTDMFFREGASYGILFHARNNLGPVGQPDPAAAGTDRRRRRDGGEGQDRRPRRSRTWRRPTERSARITWPTAISISSPRRRSWWRGSWPRPRARGRWARRRSSATPAASCRSAATTRFGSTFPTPSSATSPARTIAWRWRGGCRPWPTSSWCNWPSWRRPAEGRPGGTIEQLMAASLLPPEFGPLPDGSRVVLEGGEVHDSVRGRRGAFLPVADMPVDKITAAEAGRVQQVRRVLSRNGGAGWTRSSPA